MLKSGNVAIWSNAKSLREREKVIGQWAPLQHPPTTPHLLQPIIAALVTVQLAGGSHSVAMVMEVEVGVLQLRHLGDLI